MFEHTLFSLPFAVVAFLLESAGRPPLNVVLWIVVAVVAARNGANALNRLIDHEIDARNPRTRDRELPAGRVTRRMLWILTALCAVLFLLAAWKLNPLCLVLTPVAVVMIVGYSFTKRFTWLCHFWLGITCSAATMGSFLALRGAFVFRFFPLTAAVALWVAGFDILYALQDEEHDRSEGLHSVPETFGRRYARLIAFAVHIGTTGLLVFNGALYDTGILYGVGVVLATAILLAEHILVTVKGDRAIPLAAYRLNQVISPLVMAMTMADIYLSEGFFG